MRKYQLPLKSNACQTTLNNSLQASIPTKENRLVNLLGEPQNDLSSSSTYGQNHSSQNENSLPTVLNTAGTEISIANISLNKSLRENSSIKKSSTKEKFSKQAGHRSFQKYVILNLDKEEASPLNQLGQRPCNISATEGEHGFQEEFLDEKPGKIYTLASLSSANQTNASCVNSNKIINFSKTQIKGSPMRAGSEANTLSRDNHYTPSRRRSFRGEEQVFYEPKPAGGETDGGIAAVLGEDYCVNHPAKRAKYSSISPHQRNAKEGGASYNFCSKCAIDIALKGVRVFQKVEADGENGTSGATHVEIHSIDQIRDSDSGTLMNSNIAIQSKTAKTKEEISVRDLEIRSFLERLENIRKNTWKVNQALERNKRDIKNFYDKQVRQVEEIVKAAQDVLEKKKEQVIEKLFESQKETFSKLGKCECSLSGTRRDLENIIGDIVSNMDKILKFMETEPYNMILSRYKERVELFEKSFSRIINTPFVLSKVSFTCEKNEDKQLEEEILKNVSNFFEINSFEVNLQEGSGEDLQKLPRADMPPTVISFNNKEIFENAMKASLDKVKVVELQKGKSTSSSSNLEKNGREITDVLYDVSNITEIKRYSSPFNDRSFLSEKSQRISIANKSGVETSFIHQKDDKENETPRVGIKSNNSKYLNLLEKISNTQENTSRLYTNIIKNNPALSPEVFKEKKLSFTPVKNANGLERSEITNHEQIKLAQELLDEKYDEFQPGGEKPGQPLAQDNSMSLGEQNNSDSISSGDRKGYGNFMDFIENKINEDRKIMFTNQNYQKSLFTTENSSE